MSLMEANAQKRGPGRPKRSAAQTLSVEEQAAERETRRRRREELNPSEDANEKQSDAVDENESEEKENNSSGTTSSVNRNQSQDEEENNKSENENAMEQDNEDQDNSTSENNTESVATQQYKELTQRISELENLVKLSLQQQTSLGRAQQINLADEEEIVTVDMTSSLPVSVPSLGSGLPAAAASISAAPTSVLARLPRSEMDSKQIKTPENLPKWHEKENKLPAFDFIDVFRMSMISSNIQKIYWPAQLLAAVQNLDHKRWVLKNIVERMQTDSRFKWEAAQSAFIAYFTSTDQMEELRDKYSKCRQADQESAQDYGARFDQLRSRLALDGDTPAVTMHFIDGLRPVTQKEFKKELERLSLLTRSTRAADAVRGSLKKCMEHANAVERMMLSSTSTRSAHMSTAAAHPIRSGNVSSMDAGVAVGSIQYSGESQGTSSVAAMDQLAKARNMACMDCAEKVRSTGKYI